MTCDLILSTLCYTIPSWRLLTWSICNLSPEHTNTERWARVYVFILPLCNALVCPPELCRVIAREITIVCIWPFIIAVHCSVLFGKLLLQTRVLGRFLLFEVYYIAKFYCTPLFNFQHFILLRTFLFKIIVSVLTYVHVIFSSVYVVGARYDFDLVTPI